MRKETIPAVIDPDQLRTEIENGAAKSWYELVHLKEQKDFHMGDRVLAQKNGRGHSAKVIAVQGNSDTRKYKVQWHGGSDSGKESKWLEKNARLEQTLKGLAVKFLKTNKSQQAVDLLAQGGLRFPVFSKPVSICGTVNASNAQSERFF